MNFQPHLASRQPRRRLLLSAILAAFAMAVMPIPGHAQVKASELRANAPSRYVVVKGDTLWGISGRFLQKPWLWPSLWSWNKDVVRNPNLIYPGDVLRLDVVDGQARLSFDGVTRGEVRLSPGIRIEESLTNSVPMIDAAVIRPFLTRPLLVDPEQFTLAPRVVSSDDGRLNVGAGGRLYVAGVATSDKGQFAVYRQGPELIDPDNGQVLAVEAIYLGKVRILRQADLSLAEVMESGQEIGRGDRLVAMPESPQMSVPLGAAPTGFAGRIIKVYDSQTASMAGVRIDTVRNYDRSGGAMSVVIINRGKRDGLAVGQAVKLRSAGKTVGSNGTLGFHNGEKADGALTLPAEDNGEAVIFQAFDRVAYALVMKADKPILSGDDVATP